MKKYIVLTGGLGNQLFQIAGALSNSTEPIHVVSCLGEPRTFRGNIEISQLDFSGEILFEKCNKDHRVAKRIFALLISSATRRKSLQENIFSRIALAALGAIVFSFQLRHLVYPRVSTGVGFDSKFETRKGNFFVGYFQTYKMSERSKSIIAKALNHSPSLESIQLGDTPDLVIHSRLGDYKEEANFGVLGLDYFSKAISLLDRDNELEKIWLFSDEPESAFELMPRDVHNAIEVIGCEEDAPLEVLRAMMSGHSFVISNSTFSWWAAFLGNARQVVVPSPWFARGEAPVDLIPEDWKTVLRA